jgi:hypothetical protein
VPTAAQGPSRSLTLAALASVAALAVVLRLLDPLSNPVMAAEDPYTHMTLVREHLRDGVLDPVGGVLYPPGMHAVIGAIVAFSGVDLYQLLRFVPAGLGAVSVVGVSLLLLRYEGLLAAFVGGLALALMPEEIFRTTMAAPTALDLALLPFLMFALLEVLRGRLAWLGAAVPITLLLVLAHPWVLAIAALMLGGFLLLALLFPWDPARGAQPTMVGAAASIGLVGAMTGLAVAAFWTDGAIGPGDVASRLLGISGLTAAVVVVALALLVAAAMVVVARVRGPHPPRAADQRPVWMQRLGVGLMLVALVAMIAPVLLHGPPPYVDLPRMVGWPSLVLAMGAFLLLPLAGSPVAHIAAALMAATLPFTLYNPLDSAYWPHRTVVYLGLALAILAGVAVDRLARDAAPRILQVGTPEGSPGRPGRHGGAPSLWPQPRGARPFGAVALVAVVLAGGIAAGTPAPYQGGWYRYYDLCEFEAMQHVADLANASPDILVVTGSWQSKLIIAAFTDQAERVWYKRDLFQNTTEQANFTTWIGQYHALGYVVLDRYLMNQTFLALDFLDQAPYQRIDQACFDEAAQGYLVTIYAARRPAGAAASPTE